MADSTLAAMTAAAALSAADLFYVTQSGADRKGSAAQMKTFAQNGALVTTGYATGVQLVPFGVTSVGAGGALVQNSIRLLPFIVPATITIKGLGARVSTAGSSNVQLAIYANDSTLNPNRPTGTALVNTGSIVNTGTGPIGANGNVTQATLQPGLYWMAINCNDSTCVMVTQNVGSPLMTQLIGVSTPPYNAGSAACYHLSFAQTFGTWPDLTGQAFTEVSANGAATNATAALYFFT